LCKARLHGGPDRPLTDGGSSASMMAPTLVDSCFLNNPSASLQSRRGSHWAQLGREEGVQGICVEFVGLAAELAADLGGAVDQRGLGFVPAQRDHHRLDPLARTGTG